KDEIGFSRIVTVDEVRKQDWSINIPLYVANAEHRRTEIRSSGGSLSEPLANWITAAESTRAAVCAVLGAGLDSKSFPDASELKANMPPWLDRSKWQRMRFDQIAANIRETGQPTAQDSSTYIGLEHMDTGSLHVRRWGSHADLKGQKLRM